MFLLNRFGAGARVPRTLRKAVKKAIIGRYRELCGELGGCFVRGFS